MKFIYGNRITRIGKHIASGAYASVYKTQGDKSCVVKVQSKDCQQELDILLNLHSSFFPTIYSAYLDGDKYYMVMEFVEGVTISKHVKGLSTEQYLNIFMEKIKERLDEVINLMRSIKLVHMDLNSSNVLLTPTKARVIDFDRSTLNSSSYDPYFDIIYLTFNIAFEWSWTHHLDTNTFMMNWTRNQLKNKVPQDQIDKWLSTTAESTSLRKEFFIFI